MLDVPGAVRLENIADRVDNEAARHLVNSGNRQHAYLMLPWELYRMAESMPALYIAVPSGWVGRVMRNYGDRDQPGRPGPARLASRSASIASKVIQIGRSPLSQAHRAVASPP